MISNSNLFTIGNFNFRFHHLLIIGILAISFSISFMIRSQPADYGFELNEFDPFFNYRATQFIVENGIVEYFNWHDDMSWHPDGRDVSSNSQVMLHITAASLYQIFGGNSTLYDFTIIFPVVFGSLTAIVLFALVRVIAGTTAGLFACLFYSVSVPVMLRGQIGWFKSEPLGLFFGLLAVYLLLSAISSRNSKISFAKLIGGGIFFALGVSAWGGIQFFVLPLGLFFLALPFLRKDHDFIRWTIPVFIISFLLTGLAFERPGINFVCGLIGFIIVGPTIFLFAYTTIQKLTREGKRLRNGLYIPIGIILSAIALISINCSSTFLGLPSFRYLNAANPFLTTQDPLVDSVAEHATTTLAQSFWFLSILMIFAGIGIWFILKNKDQIPSFSKLRNDMIVFTLIICLAGVYISSAFIRLELFASISVIILSSIGLSVLTSMILINKKIKDKKISNNPRIITRISYFSLIIILLVMPLTIPENGNWVNAIKAPPTILNGGSVFNVATDDWHSAMEWLNKNTPEDAVIASWWDYGYWITTLGERITLADNATVSTLKIQKIAKTLLSPPDEAWEMLQEQDADYFLIFVAGQRIGNDPNELYVLRGGGDESKKQWFMRIAEEPLGKYLHQDGVSGTDLFWQNTLFGKMIPFSVLTYVNLNTNAQSENFQLGFSEIFVKDIKFPNDSDGPLRLVYSSPSFDRTDNGPIIGVFIYEINQDYKPKIEN
ncbi:MAG: glycosyltransferase family 39 protein [Thaumarchaeota archaeon]|nr:glycosyltransferase family 39 protein [Nitrososphaerota archaeon]